MPGFTTVQQAVDAWNAGAVARLPFLKTLPSTTVTRIPHTLWLGTGTPAAPTGNLPTTTPTVTNNGTGGIRFPGASTGKEWHLAQGSAWNASGNGCLVLVDRIVHCLVNLANGNQTLTGMDATSRLATGEGAQIWIEVATAGSASQNIFTFTYTNQAGTPGRTSPNALTTASQAVGRSINTHFWQVLQQGDQGVRSIQSFTLSGTQTGTVYLTLVRPLAWFPMQAASVASERNFFSEIVCCEKVYDDSCLTFLIFPNFAASATFGGEVVLVEN